MLETVKFGFIYIFEESIIYIHHLNIITQLMNFEKPLMEFDLEPIKEELLNSNFDALLTEKTRLEAANQVYFHHVIELRKRNLDDIRVS